MRCIAPRCWLAVLCAAALAASGAATLGVDISVYQGAVGSSTWGCLVNNGRSFAIVQALDGGRYNDDLAGNVAAAWDAGMRHVDIYAFMCTQCQSGSPQSQVQALVNWVRGKGVRFGMLWFDVESCDGCWSSESENANFIAAAVQEARSMGVNVGIYSSHYEWGLVMGDWAGLSGYPCWYADYDGATNFNDFEAYGGWSRPSIKQYDGDVSVCGLDLDEDWYPDSLDALPPFYNATAASV